MKAKYVAATSDTQTAVWLQMLLKELVVPVKGPSLMLDNNQGVNILICEYINHLHMKHIDICHHFIWEHVE